ncbi:4-hydroxythreonine-4-phosphate dehydrogenase PdxA [Leeuwenhoekiella parthenopeia]|uniref:4-hydroxythreonine-4-phosphate dehydrogenase PdxA n=1 Tax=Leeuwenhoekiella parthenopeia TaxID=2890320 RepID=A0ABS8GUJ1_9FLAO|nr:4-hydroxythreonine-4-phosphate dehydrogenase PdxA [Leeuwenhoekiella parthenopeia]MCC4212228.1 4-hydroxythreonine-4-phosphate dehydrogenase PdxA [Leeuwenhoekiella parthenopeia]
MKEQSIKLGISIGDLNGIGGEIVMRTLEDALMLDLCTPVIFASAKTVTYILKHFELDLNFQGIKHASQAIDGKINVVNVWNENPSINFGKEDPEAGAYAIKSLKAAVEGLKNGDVDVLVTAPINKASIQAEDFKFPGHTDYLNQELEGNSLMFMVSEHLKVGLLTDHVPVSDISLSITADLIKKKFETIHQSLIQDFGVERPKIAFLGINPHVGDNGVIGKEDDTVLIPTLAELRSKGKITYGPYAADSFFGSGNYKNFDAIIAAYHDQGLIPFKTLAFGKGVNYTAGLNKVRTSPDHGTAFEIAGKGVADTGSFKEAVFMALDIYKKREEYAELTQNVLKKQPRKKQPGGRSRQKER